MDRSHSRYEATLAWRENLGSVSVLLTADDLRDIEQAASGIKVQGARYPEELLKLSGR
jgi:hypothetical protein